MSTVPNPVDFPELYEGMYLAGVLSPGKLTLSGHDRVVDWDIKKGSGQSGATMTKRGEDPIEFTATFYLVQDVSQGIDDFEAWPAFLDLINSTVNGKTPKALEVYHPDLIANDIKSIVKKSVGGVVHDGKGGQTITVKFIEYRPPKKAGGSPSGSGTKPKKANAPDPNQAAQDEIARLTEQYKKTDFHL